MGNCCKTASSEEWGGEDWGSLTSKRDTKRKLRSSRKVFDEVKLNTEKHIVSDSFSASSSSYQAINGKIKIQMTKRELDFLLGKTGKMVSAEQVLVWLMKAREINNHRGPWRPVLDSIPEVN